MSVTTLTAADISVLIRRRMGMPVNARLRFLPLINLGLKTLAKDVAEDRHRRHLMLTAKASTVATLDADGIADLTTLIDNPRILLDCLKYGNIYHADSSFPLVPLSGPSEGALGSNYSTDSLAYWLEGVFLHTRSADNNATRLSGDLSFAVPYWATLAQLEDQLVESLVDHCTEQLQENRAIYEQEDGE